MSPIVEEGVSLGHRWVATYNRFLFLTLALRRLVDAGPRRGSVRAELTAAAREAIELEDYLIAFGYRPMLLIVGDEARLWAAAKTYVHALPWDTPPAGATAEVLAEDVARIHAAWEAFEQVAARVSEAELLDSPVLHPRVFRPDGLLRLLGSRRPWASDQAYQFVGEPAGQPLVRSSPLFAGANGHAATPHPVG